jgi:hypothetical protein
VRVISEWECFGNGRGLLAYAVTLDAILRQPALGGEGAVCMTSGNAELARQRSMRYRWVLF